jgi:hypothetical protein
LKRFLGEEFSAGRVCDLGDELQHPGSFRDKGKAKVPTFVKDGEIERFYVRTGPATTELSASQTQEYIKQRFR